MSTTSRLRWLALVALCASGCSPGVRLRIDASGLTADHVDIVASSNTGLFTHRLPGGDGRAPLRWPVTLVATFADDVTRASFAVTALRDGLAVAAGRSPEVTLRAHSVVDAEVDLTADSSGAGDGGDGGSANGPAADAAGPSDAGSPADAAAGSYADAVLADRPLAYYRLGEPSGTSAADASGRGQDGVFGSGVTRHQPALLTDADAVADGATGFPGASAASDAQTVRVTPTSATAIQPTTTLSVELWLMQPAQNREGAVLLCYDFAKAPLVPLYELSLTGDHLAFHVHAEQKDSVSTLLSTNVLELNRVYHVVGTYDGTAGVTQLFLDGKLDATSSTNSGTVGHGGGSILGIGGTGNDGNSAGFAGVLDEVAIYNTVLPPERIALHAHLGRP